MKITSSGQVSIPADIRRRWDVDRVMVIDEGDRLVLVPVPDDPIRAAMGSVGDLGISTEEMRRQAREEDAEIEERRLRQLGWVE